ncbi:hypothetical protein YC2023_028845 [Brassica napus]
MPLAFNIFRCTHISHYDEYQAILSPLFTEKQAHRRFGRGGVDLLLIEELELGKIKLDKTFEERDLLNDKTVLGDIIAPNGVRVAME